MWIKYYLTFFMFLTSLTLGIHKAIIGATLPGFLRKLDISIADTSYYVLTEGIGMFLAGMLSGIICRKLGSITMMVLAYLFLAGANGIVGYTTNILYVIIAYFFIGYTLGTIMAGMLNLINDLWGDDASLTIQIVSTGAALGRIIQPLIVLPFIPQHNAAEDKTNQTHNFTNKFPPEDNSSVVNSSLVMANQIHNFKNKFLPGDNSSVVNSSVVISNQTLNTTNQFHVELDVGFAYYIAGSLSIFIGLCLALSLIFKRKYESLETDQMSETEFFSKSKHSTVTGTIILVLGTMQLFIMRGTIPTISNLLLSYLQMRPNGANYETGLIDLAIYGTVFFAARFSAALITKLTGTTLVLVITIGIFGAGSILLLFNSIVSYWYPVMIMGAGLAGQNYASMGWLKDHIGINASGAAFNLSWSVLGFTVIPIVGAQIIDHFGYHSFEYLLITCFGANALILIIMLIMNLFKRKVSWNDVNDYGTLNE